MSALVLSTLPAILLAFVVLPRSKGIFTRLTANLNGASKRKGRPESAWTDEIVAEFRSEAERVIVLVSRLAVDAQRLPDDDASRGLDGRLVADRPSVGVSALRGVYVLYRRRSPAIRSQPSTP